MLAREQLVHVARGDTHLLEGVGERRVVGLVARIRRKKRYIANNQESETGE